MNSVVSPKEINEKNDYFRTHQMESSGLCLSRSNEGEVREPVGCKMKILLQWSHILSIANEGESCL